MTSLSPVFTSRCCRLVNDQAPRHYLGYYLLGFAMRCQGKPAEAKRHLRKAIRIWPSVEATPDYTAGYLQLGLLLRDEGKMREARAALERAADAAPDWAEPRYYLGEMRARERDWDGAEDRFREAVRLEPRNPQLRTALRSAMTMIDSAMGDLRQFSRTRIGLKGHPPVGMMLYRGSSVPVIPVATTASPRIFSMSRPRRKSPCGLRCVPWRP